MAIKGNPIFSSVGYDSILALIICSLKIRSFYKYGRWWKFIFGLNEEEKWKESWRLRVKMSLLRSVPFFQKTL